LVQFLVEDHNEDEDPWPWNNEPIYRNGVYCGLTTSSAYGFGLERHICLGFVHDYDPATGKERPLNPTEFILDKGARFEINIAGKMFPARALLYPPILPSPSSYSSPSPSAGH
jgi:pyruvate dehydrogenase phosphatase regulatory subunit